MHYAVAGGWFLDRKDFGKFDTAMKSVVQMYGPPTSATCGHMPGCEKFAIGWFGLHLTPDIKVIKEVMPVARAQAFWNRRPQLLLCFSSGSPANVVLKDFLSARGVPIFEVKV